MIEITLFGVLAGTLVSGLSVVLLLVALGAAAFLGFTAFTAAHRLGPGPGAVSRAGTALREVGRRWSPRAGVATSLAMLVLALAGVRLHDAGSSAGGWLFTIAVAMTASTAAGAWSAALCLAGWRSFATLTDRSEERRAQIESARRAANLEAEARGSLFLAGDDLRMELDRAETGLAQLGGALAALERIETGLRARQASTDTTETPTGAAAFAGERAELESHVARKVELGRKIRAEAEIAVFRLRCMEPLRRLVRRRPRDATASLGHAAAGREALRVTVAGALPEVQRFLGEVRATGEALSALDGLRPSRLDPSSPEDPLTRARRELAAIEGAYAAVARRVEVVGLRLEADAGLSEVASAAGALSPSQELAGLDEAELDQLIEEVSRADAALSIGLPGDASASTVSEALALGAAALERNDGGSLDDLARAMKDIE